MLKLIRTHTLILAFPALLLVACASKPPLPDIDYKSGYDFTAVKKIGFYRNSGQVSGDNPMQLSDVQRDRLDEALGTALEARGVEIVDDPADADLLLSWHLVTQNKTDVRTYETPAYGMSYGAGYGHYNRYSMYNCWNCTNTEVRVSNYTAGTFIIDLIDPDLQKSVWRSVTQSKLKGDADQSREAYLEAANRVLGIYPKPE